MYSISLNMKFWDDGQTNSTRIRNVNFCWKQLKKFTEYLRSHDILADCFLYDFSPIKIIEDSKHIPYPLGVYKKAEKTNIILNENHNYDFFMMIDSDAFFHEKDYDFLVNLFKSLKENDIITFDLAKLNDNISDYIVDNKFRIENADWSFAYSGDRIKGPLHHHTGGLGGVYICYTKILLDLGGFDERFEGWGGEDGEMLGRIWSNGYSNNIKPNRDFFPFHLPHFSDWTNENYSKKNIIL